MPMPMPPPEEQAVDMALGGPEGGPPAGPPAGSDPIAAIVQILQNAGLDEATIMAILQELQGGGGASPGAMMGSFSE